jgi:hypothetical protein
MTMQSFLEELSAFTHSLARRDHRLPDSPLHWMMLANGDADFHDNVIFFGFREGMTDPVLVAKVPRLIENGWMLQTEYDRLVELWECAGEEAARYVPVPYALPSLQERPTLMLSYVPGESLTRLSRRSFWMDQGRVASLSREAAKLLRELHRLTASPPAASGPLDRSFSARTETFQALFSLTVEEQVVLAEVEHALREQEASATHLVIVQGDFWHGNMIRHERHGLRLIDWQFARWSADVSMDVYFFLLAGALSAAESEDPALCAREAFALLDQWRQAVIPEYLAAYGSPQEYALLPEKYGMLLCCVEKATRSALEFGYSHPDDLAWRYLFGELLRWQDGA